MTGYRYRDERRVNDNAAWRSRLIRDPDDNAFEAAREWADYMDKNARARVAYDNKMRFMEQWR